MESHECKYDKIDEIIQRTENKEEEDEEKWKTNNRKI